MPHRSFRAAAPNTGGSPSQPIRPAAFKPRQEGGRRRRFQARPLTIALGAVLLTFLLSLWFLFTARSVQFTFEPADAQLDIDGGLSLRLGERYLLRPGSYRLQAEAPGHYDLEQDIEVTGEDAQAHHLELQRLPGKLTFTSEPEGARVLLGEQELGVTPLRDVDVAAGHHELRMLAARRLPHRGEIEVIGMEQPQSYAATLDPAWANIGISSMPPGATIYIDGEVSGHTPAVLEILQGEHLLSLEAPDHRTAEQRLAVRAGVDQDLDLIRLAPADGILTLESLPAGANVTVGGEYRGRTPLDLALEPGRDHSISVLKPGFERAERSVSLQPGERRDMSLTLSARLGDVLIQVEPANARVLVNGEFVGEGARTLSLPAYEQTLQVELEGYRGHRQRFTPRPGLGQVISVRLQTEAEATLAALPTEIQSPAGQTLRLFTPGELTMGASRREPGRRANEVLHPVSLTRMFYLGTHEVTNGEFRKFRKDHTSGFIEGKSLNQDKQPVVKLGWTDAALYCNWLSKQAGLPPFYTEENGEITGYNKESTGYRLPSEAEWAWAARVRGETLLKYPWGENFPPTTVTGNYADATSSWLTGRVVPNYNDGQAVSAPVGSFPANHRGLHDMGGNVAEWAHDVYNLPSQGGAPVVDPLGAQRGSNHVIRGASWAQGTVTELRLSFRDYGNTGRDDVGFRVARFAAGSP